MSQKIRGRRASTIAASIEQAVLAGRLEDRLPPIRQLAASLRVSPVTVASAYRIVQARGLAVASGRRGTTIRRRSAVVAPVRARPGTSGLVDLATGDPDPTLLPPIESVLSVLAGAHARHAQVPELPELAAFAKAEFEADGVPKGAVAVTSGGLDAIERTLRDHLRAGDRVIVEDPTFPALLDVLASLGVAPEPCGLDEEGPRPDLVERALSPNVRAVVLSSRGQNPTGAALSVRRAANLARVLSRRPHVLVVELDDASAVAGVPLATVTADRLRWIVVRSLSKLLGPDVRIAVVTGDATTIARLRHRQAASIRWVSHLLQTVAHGLWSDPASARRLVRVAEVYAERRIALVTELASRGFEVHPRSGFNVWIPVREEAATVLALAECGWAVAAGERFRLKSPPAIRVTTSTLSPSDARRFAADLAAVHRGAPLPPERVRSSHD